MWSNWKGKITTEKEEQLDVGKEEQKLFLHILFQVLLNIEEKSSARLVGLQFPKHTLISVVKCFNFFLAHHPPEVVERKGY